MSALPIVFRFPAAFTKTPLRRNTLVHLSRLLLETHQAAALSAVHTRRYTSMRRYWRRLQTRRRVLATVNGTDIGSKCRHIMYHSKMFETARR